MSDLRVAVVGAFAGALFALSMQKAVGAYLGVQGRKLRHLGALHELDIAFNRFYNASISWKTLLKRFQTAADEGRMVFALPEAFELNESVQRELIDPDCRTRLLEFAIDVDRMNRDFRNFRDAYRLLQQNHWSGAIPVEAFQFQAHLMAEGAAELIRAIEEMDTLLLDLWAFVQTRYPRDQSLYIRVRSRMLALRKVGEPELREARAALVTRLEKSTRRLGDNR